ncbi:MAG: glycosyltransferase [Proteobacteria bacterium]|nr:glycosyltransferase [Pseudomonadota bacterium]
MSGDVLLLSQRRIASLVACCVVYEFEDVVAAVTDSARIDVDDRDAVERSRRFYKLFRYGGCARPFAERSARLITSVRSVDNDFELFFPVFNHSYELYSLTFVPDWRQRCRKAACFLSEVGTDKPPDYLIELLADFDHIFLGVQYAVEDVARITGRPCTYLPPAADVVRFSAGALERQRVIDICNIGRRSSITHKALLDYSEKTGDFYYYDTVAASGSDLKDRTFRVASADEHRRLLSNLVKRSNFFLANKGHIDRGHMAMAKDLIAARFAEGAAAGAVMVGETPATEDFKRYFGWTDAVIHVPFDSPDIGSILDELKRDPDRLARIRATNISEAAQRHDWLHRLQTIYETLGLAPTAGMRARAQVLERISRDAAAGAAARPSAAS